MGKRASESHMDSHTHKKNKPGNYVYKAVDKLFFQFQPKELGKSRKFAHKSGHFDPVFLYKP